ncbi:MAG: glycosyltransferase family 4 protein, partial [Candidatus Sacchiramonaceae bacterium]|nr:glycosyltransferase family 4 protein [Candidatus Saccharimonadaceae bacterium]
YKHPERIKMPVEAVSNGIDLAKFTPEQLPKDFYDKFELSSKKKYICHIGRVDAEKHISTLIEAFALISDKNPKTDLVIVGDGTDMARLQNLSYQLKIADRVHFMGTQLGEDLVNFHRLATVFCSPSPTETQGIVFLEAAACGKPVIGVDVGAVKEICQDGINGFLCETDNCEQIAESLNKILNDKKLRDKFSKASLEIIKHHDLDFTLNKFEEIYQFVLSEKQKEADGKILNKLTAKFKSKK